MEWQPLNYRQRMALRAKRKRLVPMSNSPDAYHEYNLQKRKEASVLILTLIACLLLLSLFIWALSLGSGTESVPSSVLFTGNP